MRRREGIILANYSNPDSMTSVADVGNGFRRASQKVCQKVLVLIGCGMQLEG